MSDNVFLQVGVSLFLGLLVGLQREKTESSIAGFRTFPIITVFGTVCALLASQFGGWVLAAGIIGVAAVIISANFIRSRKGEVDPGTTTEAAALLMFVIGGCMASGHGAVAVALGGAVAVLLHLKKPLHEFAAKVGDVDVKGIMQFALVSLVVLPVLPNRAFGPFSVLNPYKIWMLVVLISGISLAAHLAQRLMGAKAGTLAGGFLGGIVSSTATTVSYSRLAASSAAHRGLAASVIMIASAMVYVRMLIEVATVAPGHFARLSWPLMIMLAVSSLTGLVAYLLARKAPSDVPQQDNPANLKSAVLFGGLFAGVLLAVAAAKEYLGSSGILLVSILSGLTDVDAITLSTAHLVQSGSYNAASGCQGILVASMSNLVFKCVAAGVIGGRELLWRTGPLMVSVLAVGGVILWLS